MTNIQSIAINLAYHVFSISGLGKTQELPLRLSSHVISVVTQNPKNLTREDILSRHLDIMQHTVVLPSDAFADHASPHGLTGPFSKALG